MANLRDENTIFPREWSINLGGKLFTMNKPEVMGIVNCTPDSFYSESRLTDFDSQKSMIDKHVQVGATWLDLGAYSSRPGATDISFQEEIDRLGNALIYIQTTYPDIKISVDTFRSEVARFVLKTGPAMINDISGGDLDPEILKVVAEFRAPYLLMHMRGTPQTMAQDTKYNSIVNEVITNLSEKIKRAEAAGIKDIIVDPGFGFAKTTEQNFELFKAIEFFHVLERPILVGISRKSMIYKTLNCTPEEALNGTSALHLLALQQGIQLLRVHDVRETMEIVKLYEVLNNGD